MRSITKRLQWGALLVALALLALFMVQNAARIELQFLSWTISTRRAALVLAMLAIGFALGWMFGRLRKRY